MALTRRVFLRSGALAAVGMTAASGLMARVVLEAGERTARTRRLVVIFQRGAADGLNIVVPHGDPHYYALRPSIGIPRKAVLDLDGFFGLHPSLAAFLPLWRQGHLAVVHAAGSPHPTRCHFEAQDFMESGMPGVRVADDGWLNRSLRALPQGSPFRAIALGSSLPRILSGPTPSLAANPVRCTSAHRAHDPTGRFGDNLRQLAQLIKANLGVQVAFADIGGWDHHVNQGSTKGQLANVLADFSQSLAAFWTDLGDLREETIIVTMSEFGRAARENGNRGTDHGHANVMFVLGGPVKGGKVYGRWPGLDQSQLYEGRDLAVTTDFRQVIGEVLAQHMGNSNLSQVFPGFDCPRAGFHKLVG